MSPITADEILDLVGMSPATWADALRALDKETADRGTDDV